jgi:ribonuclease E
MPDQTDSQNSPTPQGKAADDAPAEKAAPARRRRAASRPAGPPASSAEEGAAASGGDVEAAPAKRRTRKTAAAAEAPAAPEAAQAEGAGEAAEAAPAPARRRATRKAAAPAAAEAAATEAAGAAEAAAAAEEEAPAKPRRRATRKAAAPEAAVEAEPVAEEGAAAAEEPAPARTRRRATRKASAPAPAAEAAPAAEEAAEAPAAEEEAAPARTRRRATRKAAAPEAAVEAEAAPEAPAAEPQQEPAAKSRRTRKKAAPAATFSAGGDGSRRLKPGALAPREDQAAAPGTAYAGRLIQDGGGWAVEVDDAYEIRGYGDTPEEAAAQAVAALADAFGIPADAVELDVRTEEPARRGRRRVVSPPTAVFQPPVFGFGAPAPAPAAEAEEEAEPEAEEHEGGSRRRRRRRGGSASAAAEAAEQQAVPPAEEAEPAAEGDTDTEAEDEGDGEERPSSRRRRRGGRRRRRGESAEHEDAAEDESGEEAEDSDEAADEDEHDEHAQGGGSGSSSSRRRRRRRRRGGDASGDEQASGADDPERTVVKVREPRPHQDGGTGADQVQSIKGSTRLEAKKQRRREGREQGRRRVPIITEAEFLARREAVERVMVVRQNGDRTQIGVLEDNVLVEHYVNKEQATSYVGNVYLGKVQNVLPSMEAAFVDIGKGRNAVLYAGEVNFDALGLSGGPRRIESALKSGQPVLVQVTKDPIGHKGARLTSQVSLPGRYLVYVPEGSMTGISRKLPDTERARLKTILKKIVPEDAGVIVRTAAEGASEDELRRDVERLQAQWEDIQRKAKQGGGSNAPTLLYGEPDMTVRVVRDIFNEDFSKVIVSGDDAWNTVHDYVAHVAPDLVDRLSRWTSEVDVFATYRIDEQLLKALDRKVWLPSGGSLVIDKTEAMVVIDVNTGKFTGQGGNLEETVTRNNLEAAEEIVRQLRLRDLGGIVVVDFIDMVLESNRDLVMRRLLECLGRDRTKHQVAEVTSLGLVQMTRKRVGQGLLESFSETCVHCNGRGVIVHMDQATTSGGGGGKRKRRGGKAAEAAEPAVAAPAVAEEEVPELEPIEVGESDLIPSVGDPEEEWFGTAAEAEAAAKQSRGRTRRRATRQAAAPVAGESSEPAVVVVPVSEPEVEPVQAPEPEPAVSTEPPARTRRRATRKATAPAGAPPAAEEAAVVVVAPDAAPPAPAAALPEPEVSTEPPARTRRRATRTATAPAAAEEAAVVVVPTSEPEPKKRAPRKAAAKKTAAKKSTSTKKAAPKKKSPTPAE